MHSPHNPSPETSPLPCVQRSAPSPALSSQALFQGAPEVVIRHDGQDYRLRITRQNKLILTK